MIMPQEQTARKIPAEQTAPLAVPRKINVKLTNLSEPLQSAIDEIKQAEKKKAAKNQEKIHKALHKQGYLSVPAEDETSAYEHARDIEKKEMRKKLRLTAKPEKAYENEKKFKELSQQGYLHVPDDMVEPALSHVNEQKKLSMAEKRKKQHRLDRRKVQAARNTISAKEQPVLHEAKEMDGAYPQPKPKYNDLELHKAGYVNIQDLPAEKKREVVELQEKNSVPSLSQEYQADTSLADKSQAEPEKKPGRWSRFWKKLFNRG